MRPVQYQKLTCQAYPIFGSFLSYARAPGHPIDVFQASTTNGRKHAHPHNRSHTHTRRGHARTVHLPTKFGIHTTPRPLPPPTAHTTPGCRAWPPRASVAHNTTQPCTCRRGGELFIVRRPRVSSNDLPSLGYSLAGRAKTQATVCASQQIRLIGGGGLAWFLHFPRRPRPADCPLGRFAKVYMSTSL